MITSYAAASKTDEATTAVYEATAASHKVTTD
jgi:hypothetical protein